MKTKLILLLLTLLSYTSYAQCYISEEYDEFYKLHTFKLETFSIGKFGYITRFSVTKYSEDDYSVFVEFGDMSSCDVMERHRILFKWQNEVVELKSTGNHFSKVSVHELHTGWLNTAVYKANKEQMQWLATGIIDGIRIEHINGYKDIELKKNDPKEFEQNMNCIFNAK
jgi:hypothetical protein